MPPSPKPSHEVGLLRLIVGNLALRPASEGKLTLEVLRTFGMGQAKRDANGVRGILYPGIEPFAQLSETMFIWSPRVEHGTAFRLFQDELFDHLFSNYLEKQPGSLGVTDVLAIHSHLEEWFDARATNQTIFVPCMITPAPSPRVTVGPVSFLFIDDVPTSEFYPKIDHLEDSDFKSLLEQMRQEKAHWLAAIDVNDCDQDRAYEIADLAVDLAIVAFQLAAPYLGTKTMSRLDARRGSIPMRQLSLSQGRYAGGWSYGLAGSSIGKGYLGHIVKETAPIIAAVGNRVRSFVTGSFKFPRLEQAWCDAAYWLHEGLAEPLDSIAVAKLETALEVLLRAESTRGSEGRLTSALDTFYGLAHNDPITPHTATTTKQFVQRFVRERSRVLHGTASTLRARLSNSREALENVATTLIRAYALELDSYASITSPSDDTDTFLMWIKSRKQYTAQR